MSVEILRPTIEIQMLGEFAITINGNTITNLKGRTKRVWMLIEYLIANRHSDISIEKLIDVLWGEGGSGKRSEESGLSGQDSAQRSLWRFFP